MSEELSYVMITPYTIVKSRTGGVIARLLSRVELEFCAAQIFAPSRALAEAYADAVLCRPCSTPRERVTTKLISDYILSAFTPSEGRRHRVMLLLFRGESACGKLRDIVGEFYPHPRTMDMLSGETIRDTYADLIMSRENPEEASYFEPAVLTPPSQELALRNLGLFASFVGGEPNLVENMRYPNPDRIERTLVIIKPDNWRYRSSRPGTIIDMFSRTGLRIIGCKLNQMSIAEAMEFYAPVKSALEVKLAPVAAAQARQYLESRFEMKLGDDVESQLTSSLGRQYAAAQFNRIIEFMSGSRPEDAPASEWDRPGRVKSMAMVYEGEQAVQKIRGVLGPTDPTLAPGGTVRKEFGSDIMVNTAHASDSVENARREMAIVKIQQNSLADTVGEFIRARKA